MRTQFSIEEEDDLLQFAIQQSLIDAGSERDEVRSKIVYFYSIICINLTFINTSLNQVDIWEALKAQKPSRPSTPNMTSEEEKQLQRYE